jgi:glycosyltransferase involved in cell wall biosynthesis
MQPISFITNTGANTLDYTKLLLRSLKQNLVGKEHEIIVFIDKDNDGTYEYLKSIKKDFFDLKIVTHKLQGPVGYQRNSNLLVDIAKHDIVSYLQSDMVISPGYDMDILSQIEEDCITSSTRVEPPLHGPSNVVITKDFGTDPTKFDMTEWMQYSVSVKEDKTENYFFAPYTFYKKTWQKIGGYDTIFRRSREDSDFVQRCIHAGIKLKQSFRPVVYHFTCVSSRGKNWFDQTNEEAQKRVELQKIADGIELRRFIQKWGNFNHGEEKLSKLDMDLVILEDRKLHPMFLVQLEPFFSRVWLRTEDERDAMISIFSNQHEPANELLGFSNEGWEEASKLFRQTDFESIYRVGEPEDFNIKIEVDFSKAQGNQDPFLQNLTRLDKIVGASQEPGMYELGVAKIEIRKVIIASDQYIKVDNPPFDMTLLTIE